MEWIKYTIETTTQAQESVVYMLSELGIDSTEIKDLLPIDDSLQGGTFPELQPNREEDDGKSYISFYISSKDNASELLENVKIGLSDLRKFLPVGSGAITKSITKEDDWINNWKKYFSSFTIGNIYIKPTWEEFDEEKKDYILIEIDPGISFGTGKHESTQLCIMQLQKYITGKENILDVGCGSGILSVVAKKLGAISVCGTDIDKDCIVSTYDNLQSNGVDISEAHFFAGNLIDDISLQEKLGQYDIVVANILADIIIEMAEYIVPHVKRGGYFITSGIIDFKEEEVKTALQTCGFEIVEINHLGEWVNITARLS